MSLKERVRQEKRLALSIGVLIVSLSAVCSQASAEEARDPAKEALERRQKVEIMSFFSKDPAQAMMPQTTLAIGFYNQAVEHMRKSEYTLARQALKESLVHDAENVFAYELLGDIDYLEQKLADAKENYQIAYNLAPGKALSGKIEKLRSEANVEKKLSTYREQHFIIKYHNEERNIEGFALRELLRKTYLQISKDFAFYFKHQVVVLLYDEEDFKKVTNMPHWVGGVYDGKVRMPINRKGFSDRDLEALTAHEVTHAFVSAMSAGMAPAWINEGLAEYEENKIQLSGNLMFRSAVKTGKLFPLDQLMGQGAAASLQDPVLIGLFYEQSHELVKYMVDRYGMFRIKQVLGEFGKGKNSDEALREVLHISPVRLEKEWTDTFPKKLR